MESLTVEKLSFCYPGKGRMALDDVSFSVESGAFVTVAGPSGCGKSTLLRQFKTALTPQGLRQGTVLFQGNPMDSIDLRTQARHIGFVQQDAGSQIVTDKVWHELAFGLESLGYDTPVIRRKVAEMASFFGIEPWFHREIHSLSGGQKQILNLAAVMVMQPSLLILDEPTAQLDPIAATNFLETLYRVNRELGTTVLLTEHRLEEAIPMSDRVIVLDRGRVLCDGTPREVGLRLRELHHSIYSAMPTPLRVYTAVEGGGACPLTVREGRSWLEGVQKIRGLSLLPETAPYTEAGKVPLAELQDVWFRYEKASPDIVKGLSFRVYPGEFFALMGGNGTGKSTALSMLSGLNRPYRGKVLLDSKPLAHISSPYKGFLGVLPQDPKTLFLRSTVREDLRDMLPGEDPAQEEARFQRVIANCRLEALLDAHPYDLSGGEQQRVALGKVLLLSPRILLLDEPTKGMDSGFKPLFAQILSALLEGGVAIVMVSHDVEFVAQYAHRCAMLFDGEIAGMGTPREFFAGNGFYTTAANRMARALLPGAITDEDIIRACGAVPPEIRHMPEAPPSDDGESGAPPVVKKAARIKKPSGRGQKKRIVLSLAVLCVLMPLTLFLGVYAFGDRKYFFVSLALVLEAMLPLLLLYEGRKPSARELVLVAVLCALAIAGRLAFFMVPSFKPVLALVIITGVTLGCETGFLVGALTMFVSNFFLGQGPWTPWQMLAMGLAGFLGGIMFANRHGGAKRIWVCVFGAFAAVFIYGGILNPASVLMYQSYPTWEMLAAAYLTGLPMDSVHAAATVFFLWVCLDPFREKIARVTVKHGFGA